MLEEEYNICSSEVDFFICIAVVFKAQVLLDDC